MTPAALSQALSPIHQAHMRMTLTSLRVLLAMPFDNPKGVAADLGVCAGSVHNAVCALRAMGLAIVKRKPADPRYVKTAEGLDLLQHLQS